MILLEKEKYGKLIEPLKTVTINNLFARSVIENHVFGSVYVDNANNPKTFYVAHPYGMSLLFGNFNNHDFNAKFRDYALNINQIRKRDEWMQVFPKDWDIVLNDLFKGHILKSSENTRNIEVNIVEINTRINFKFNPDKYIEFKQNNSLPDLKIVRTNEKMFKCMKGTVIPLNFWKSAEEFCKKGVGFSLYHENNLASTAYSSFVHDDKLELGIETAREFRGKGFAHYVCSVLIDYCLENNYEPVWSCKLENTGSYKLAQKLGFEPVSRTPYYRLSK